MSNNDCIADYFSQKFPDGFVAMESYAAFAALFVHFIEV